MIYPRLNRWSVGKRRDMGKAGTLDLAVVGGGIFGLSCAYAAARSGTRVCVLERERPGAGASGGLVGALSPHLPLGWNERKQFQLDALAGAEAYWREVEATGGLSPSYGRIGRYLPLSTASERAKMLAQGQGARANWPDVFEWEVLAPEELPSWLDPAVCSEGAVRETLTARLHPRHALAALEAAVNALGGQVRYPAQVISVAPGEVRLADEILRARAIVVAAGCGGEVLAPGFLGRGEKGQAALLAPAEPLDALVYADGLYIVPHEDGTVAVGSTSESDFDDPLSTDAQLEGLLARAARICPALDGAGVLERWAGVRPRGPKPHPIVGPLPDSPGVNVANGGFKTGFGLAPLIGRAVADMIADRPHGLPATFLA
jgi:glycine oxidase